MKTEIISLRPENPAVTLTTYIADAAPELKMPPRPAIVVFPGGGYTHLSPREAEPIAMKFWEAGFQAFVLRYSINEHAAFPNALVDASRAVSLVRERAGEYNVDPARVFVIGFSAGGHLAATLGTMYDKPCAAFPGMKPGSNRPDGMILSYAPTSVETEHIAQSFMRTVGRDLTLEELRGYSPDHLVTKDTPPAYIWHTFADPVVPVEHSLRMADALAAAGVPFEMHIFPAGPHGLSLANELTFSQNEKLIVPEAQQWIDEAAAWAKRL